MPKTRREYKSSFGESSGLDEKDTFVTYSFLFSRIIIKIASTTRRRIVKIVDPSGSRMDRFANA